MALPQSFKIMTEERVCKSCGRPVDYLEYKEGNGKCYQCQPGYGGHSYTEGSEPIQLTEQERIKHVITQLEIKLREAIREANHEIKQRDETIKQLKEALKEILMYCEEDGRPVDGFQLRDNILTAKRLTQ